MHKSSQTFPLSAVVIGVVALLAVVAMLVVFYSVVQGAVQDGAFRRQASVTQAAAASRCSLLQDLPARDSCLAQTYVAVKANSSGAMHASALN